MFWSETPSYLDEAEIAWIRAVFDWSQNRWAQAPRPLVLPNHDFFPGKARSAADMAQLIFEQVLNHAGMEKQGWQLIAAHIAAPSGRSVIYDPELVREPQSLIADLAYQLVLHELSQQDAKPPGDLRQAAEIIAVDWGFGLFFANSAFILPAGGCCASPVVKRYNALSQWHYTEALALFCAQNHFSYAQVKPWLKTSLRSFYRARLKYYARLSA